MTGDPWFVRGRSGIGWRPAAWPGWAIAAVALIAAAVCLIVARIARNPLGVLVGVVILVIYYAVAILMAQRKDDQPRNE